MSKRFSLGQKKQIASVKIEKDFHENSNKKRAEVAILISDKIQFKFKKF